MHSKLEHIKANDEYMKIWADMLWFIDDDNEIIDLYNWLSEWTEDKAIVWNYIRLRFSWMVWKILKIDIWEPLKEKITEEDETEELRLFDLVKWIKERFKKIV
ncbi:MAG: hypothetical protein ACD_4C00076G0006 [uncultured bacterium (gcode 4)]|uniref:Uncharacterized protein n=1 Tax=uncultured bacterium (gcode 4) TaxID=1234023 RepID=K2FVS4_9BACT|nr:MAG: hypothetical protein ACD_4C00076G0006 [uncultured bacterium (gcode 4)]